jgi:hypothetical protein
MAQVTVHRPDTEAPPASTVEFAPRGELPDQPVIGLIANGKPLAKEILTVLAEEVAKRLDRDVTLDLVAKPSAAYPIDDDEARLLAARSHLVIAGLGD